VTSVLPALTALVVTVALLWPLRKLALHLRILDDPGPRKVHTKPVPYLGGVAIFAGATAAILWLHPRSWAVVAMLASIVAVGLSDDIRYLPVWAKLIGEVSIACAAVALGFSWHVSDSAGINAGFSVLWMVGLTNSFNLLDNMDGLASTVAVLSLAAIAILVPGTAPIAVPVAGAALGFLLINRPPARMYMGDAGSLMLGFAVALCTIRAANSSQGLHSAVLLIVPVAVAVFDTSLVIVSRLASGRPVQLGGKDHFSHRLRLLGWSNYQVLGATTVACISAFGAAALAVRFPMSDAWLALPIAAAFAVAWVQLLRVDPYAGTIQPVLEVRSADGV